MTADRSTSPARPTGRTRALIAEYLRHHPGSTPKAIALGAGLSRELAKRTALRMAADGELTVAGRGHYFWVPPHRRLALVPADTGDEVPQGSTAPAVPAERWCCSQCYWRQADARVGSCELCGSLRARTVPQ